MSCHKPLAFKAHLFTGATHHLNPYTLPYVVLRKLGDKTFRYEIINNYFCIKLFYTNKLNVFQMNIKEA